MLVRLPKGRRGGGALCLMASSIIRLMSWAVTAFACSCAGGGMFSFCGSSCVMKAANSC